MIIQCRSESTRRISIKVDDTIYKTDFDDGCAEVDEDIGKILTKYVDGIQTVKQENKENE